MPRRQGELSPRTKEFLEQLKKKTGVEETTGPDLRPTALESLVQDVEKDLEKMELLEGHEGPNVWGAVKKAGLEAMETMAGVSWILGKVLPGRLGKAVEEFTETNVNYWKNLMNEDEDVKRFMASVEFGKEPIITEALGTAGPTVAALLTSALRPVGMPMAAAMFLRLNVDEIYEAARAAGADESSAKKVAWVGGSINSLLDLYGVESILGRTRVGRALKKKFKDKLARAAVAITLGTSGESTTEAVQELVSNVSAVFGSAPTTKDALDVLTRDEFWTDTLRQMGHVFKVTSVMTLPLTGLGAAITTSEERKALTRLKDLWHREDVPQERKDAYLNRLLKQFPQLASEAEAIVSAAMPTRPLVPEEEGAPSGVSPPLPAEEEPPKPPIEDIAEKLRQQAAAIVKGEEEVTEAEEAIEPLKEKEEVAEVGGAEKLLGEALREEEVEAEEAEKAPPPKGITEERLEKPEEPSPRGVVIGAEEVAEPQEPDYGKANKKRIESILKRVNEKYEGFNVKFDGWTEIGDLYQFTPQEGPIKGATFTVKGVPTLAAVKAKLEEKLKQFAPEKVEKKPEKPKKAPKVGKWTTEGLKPTKRPDPTKILRQKDVIRTNPVTDTGHLTNTDWIIKEEYVPNTLKKRIEKLTKKRIYPGKTKVSSLLKALEGKEYEPAKVIAKNPNYAVPLKAFKGEKTGNVLYFNSDYIDYWERAIPDFRLEIPTEVKEGEDAIAAIYSGDEVVGYIAEVVPTEDERLKEEEIEKVAEPPPVEPEKPKKKKKAKEKPKKKAKKIEKLKDYGEKRWKRASEDHSERAKAIKTELDDRLKNLPPKEFVETISNIVVRANLFKPKPAENATLGTDRYLKAIRNKLITFTEYIGKQHGGIGWRGPYSYKDALIREIARDDSVKDDILSEASKYSSVLELFSEAISNKASVREVREAYLKFITKEDYEGSVDEWDDADPTFLNEIGQALKWYFSNKAHFISAGNSYEENEHNKEPVQPIRSSTPLKDIEDDPNKYRNGKDVTPEQLAKEFELGTVAFGNWVEAPLRQKAVNLAFDAFADLAEVIKAPRKAISLPAAEKRLGVMFGARQYGGRAAAMYYPSDNTINLTKKRGDGTLSHEWFHGFEAASGLPKEAFKDLYLALAKRVDAQALYDITEKLLTGAHWATQHLVDKLKGARDYLTGNWEGVVVSDTEFFRAAKKLDEGKKPYYANPSEMMARAFEAFTSDSMPDATAFLVNHEYVADGGFYNLFAQKAEGYPSGEERQYINEVFRKFFDSLEYDEEGKAKLKQGYKYVHAAMLEEARKVKNEILGKLEEIYENILRGEKSEDGLYWYAYRLGRRGENQQPSGYVAHDDEFSSLEYEDSGGKGAVGYPNRLTVEQVTQYGLAAIKYEKADTTVYLKVGGEDGTANHAWSTSQEALEEAPTKDVSSPEREGYITPRLEDSGEADRGGYRGDGVGEGTPVRGGIRDSDETVDIPPARRGAGGTATESDALSDVERIDYEIKPSDGLEGRTLAQRFTDNLTAIRLLKAIEAEGRLATPQEQEILVKFSGWAGMSEAFSEFPGSGWQPRAEAIRSVLTKEEFKAIKRSTLDSYYTPPSVYFAIWRALGKLGFKGGKIFSPSVRIGFEFGTAPQELKAVSKFIGIDLDPIAAGIAKHLYQRQTIINSKFEDTSLPKDYFDLMISNVPFGETAPHDPVYNPKNFRIHDYFINRGLEHLRPGGLMAVITSVGTLDKTRSAVRREISKKADFIGAIRLPNRIFDEAEAAADILFFRKKGEGLVEFETPSWLEKAEAPGVPGLEINEYFAKNPNMVLGQLSYPSWGQSYASVQAREGLAIGEAIDEAAKNLPTAIYTEQATGVDSIDPVELIAKPEQVLDDSFYIGDDGAVYLNTVEGPVLYKAKKDWPRLKALIGIRKKARELLRASLSGASKADRERLRKELNRLYDSFVKKYGRINEKKNLRLLAKDADAGILIALEKWDSETNTFLGKETIFTEDFVAEVKEPETAKDSTEALTYSLGWKGRVDLDYMASLLGRPENEIVRDLEGRIIKDPETGWVLMEEYLSGDVRRKLRIAEKAAKHNDEYKRNVELLKKVIPEDVPIEEIPLKLGASWIPATIIKDFVRKTIPVYTVNSFEIDHVPGVGYRTKWTSYSKTKAAADKLEAYRSYEASKVYGTDEVNFFELLDYLLNGGFPKVYDEVTLPSGEKGKVFNAAKTDAAVYKMTQIQNAFREYVLSNKDIADELAKTYNEKFNSIVPTRYDGSHLVLPGKVPDAIIKLRPYQLNAIWRFLRTGRVYFAHEVGTGKTFSIIGSVAEAIRLRMAKKAIIAIPKSTIEGYKKAFGQLYPGLKVLFLNVPEKASKRMQVLNKAAVSDAKIIVVTHQSFTKIPLSPLAEAEVLQQEKDYYEAALVALAANHGGGRAVREIQNKIQKLENKIKKLNEAKRDKGPYFDDLGVDLVAIDEAHAFKNLYFPTRFTSVKGVTSNPAKRSTDLYLKTQYILTKFGKGVIFASGTPLTNSVGELYSISRYLQGDELRAKGLYLFDEWANTFGEIKQAAEPSVTGGGFVLRRRFTKFVGVSELARFVGKVLDPLRIGDKEAPGIIYVKRPKIAGGKPKQIVAPASDNVKRYYREVLLKRAQAIRTNPSEAEWQGKPDNMPYVVSDGRKAATDYRLIDPTAPDDPNSKINKAVEKIVELYHKEYAAEDPETGKDYMERNHVQLVFLDFGVPDGKMLNLYADIKQKLVAKGIPEHQIASIYDVSDKEKEKLFSKVRNGEIRVFMGSTWKMGIGVNIQDRVSVMHHIDVDWNFANYEQRNGRGHRYGNRIKEIEIYNYATEGTVDAFMWNTVAQKGAVLEQVLSPDPKVRTLEELPPDVASAQEFIYEITGDPLHKKHIELTKEVRELTAQQAEILRAAREAKETLSRIDSKVKSARKAVVAAVKARKVINQVTAIKIGEKIYVIKKHTTKINKLLTKMLASVGVEGKVAGALGTTKIEGEEVKFVPLGASLAIYKHAGQVGLRFMVEKAGFNSAIYIGSIGKALSGVKDEIEETVDEKRAEIKETISRVPLLKQQASLKFEKKEELLQKEAELRRVTEELLKKQEEEDRKLQASTDPTDWDIQESATKAIPIRKLPRKRLEEVTGRLQKKLPGIVSKIEIVEKTSEIPEDISKKLNPNAKTMGVFAWNAKTGESRIYLVRENIGTEKQAKTVLLEEVLGHLGLRLAFGDQFNEVLDRIYDKHKEEIKGIADAYSIDLKSQEGRRRATDEFISKQVAADSLPARIWAEIVRVVRQWVRKIYPSLQVSIREAKALARKAIINGVRRPVFIEDSIVRTSEEILEPAKSDRVKVSELPDSLASVVSRGTVKKLRSMEGYEAAKKRGDGKAANKIAEAFLTDYLVEAIKKKLDPNKKIVVVPVVQAETADSLNALPVSYAVLLAKKLGGVVDATTVKVSGAPNTGASVAERLTNVQTFLGLPESKDSQIVLVDDVFTSGNTLLSLYKHLADNGYDVRAMTTLAYSKPNGRMIKPSEELLNKFREYVKKEIKDKDIEVDEYIEEVAGRGPEYFTAAEIRNILRTSGTKPFRSFFAAPEAERPSERDRGRHEEKRAEPTEGDIERRALEFIGKMVRDDPDFWREEKKDTTRLDRLLSLPSNYFQKVPALWRMFQAALERTDNFYELTHELLDNGDGTTLPEVFDALEKASKDEYKKLKEYLVHRDRNQIGFRVKREDDGKYSIFDEAGKKIKGGVESEQAAWSFAIAEEANRYEKAGNSNLAAKALLSFRATMLKGFEILAANMREIIRKYEEAGLQLPTQIVTIEGKKVEVDLKRALAMMGDMRGFYFPRVRAKGEWMVKAKKEGANPVLKFYELKVTAKIAARKLRAKGYKVEIARSPALPEAIFELGQVAVNAQSAIQQAVMKLAAQKTREAELKDYGIEYEVITLPNGEKEGVIKGSVPKQVTPALKKLGGKFYARKKGEERLWRFSSPPKNMEKKILTAFTASKIPALIDLELLKVSAEALANNVVDMIKARGHRAHMIKRLEKKGEEVWVGYEEDPHTASVMYVKGLAAGEAKRKMAIKMIRAMTGTDVTWKEFKELNPEADYSDYLKFVDERRIDPVLQKNAYRDAQTYMRDMLRNQEWIERLVGYAKGVAVIQYLGGRIFSAPLVNLTALATTAPAMIASETGASLTETIRTIGKATEIYTKFKLGKLPKNHPYYEALMEITRKGWDRAQYNREMLSILRNKVGRAYDKYIDYSMAAFGLSEQLNRGATILAGYMLLSKETTNMELALYAAKRASDLAHGIYGKVDYPMMMRGGDWGSFVLQCFYTFKKFAHQYLLSLKRLWGSGWKPEYGKEFLYMLLSPAVLAGTGATVAMPIVKMMMEAFGLGGDKDDPEEKLYAWLKQQFGELGERVGRFGVFGLLGVSLKGSLQIGIGDIPTSLFEILGAPGSVIYDMYDGTKLIARGDWTKGFERILPTALGNMLKGYREYTEGMTTRNNTPIWYGTRRLKAPLGDTILRVLGFNPARTAAIREKLYAEWKQEQAFREELRDLYARYKAFFLKPPSERSLNEYAELMADIYEYNATLDAMGLLRIPRITPKSLKAVLRNLYKPPKKERLRSFTEVSPPRAEEKKTVEPKTVPESKPAEITELVSLLSTNLAQNNIQLQKAVNTLSRAVEKLEKPTKKTPKRWKFDVKRDKNRLIDHIIIEPLEVSK